MISRWVVGVVLLFGILLAMLPKTDEQSLARIASASMLMCTKDFRERVGQQILKSEPVEAEFKNACPDLIASLEVDEAGAIEMAAKKHQLKISLNPVVDNGKVRWSCRGEPATSIAKICKP